MTLFIFQKMEAAFSSVKLGAPCFFEKKLKSYEQGKFIITDAKQEVLLNVSNKLAAACRVVHHISLRDPTYKEVTYFHFHMTSFFPKMEALLFTQKTKTFFRKTDGVL